MTTVSTEGPPEVASPATVTPTASAAATAQEHTEEKAAANTNPSPAEKQLKPEIAENNDEDSDFDELDGIYNPPSPAHRLPTWNDPTHAHIQMFSMISPNPNQNQHQYPL
jgi:hypothetical protein